MPPRPINYLSSIEIRISLDDGKFRGHLMEGNHEIITTKKKTRETAITAAFEAARDILNEDTWSEPIAFPRKKED
jgi:hypothetical protein